MVNVFASECAKSWVRAPVRSIQRQQNWYLLLPHTTLRNKSKDCLARNQDNVSEWSDMSIHELLLLWSSTIQIQLSILVCTKRTSSSFHWKVACSRHDTSWKMPSWRYTTITYLITPSHLQPIVTLIFFSLFPSDVHLIAIFSSQVLFSLMICNIHLRLLYFTSVIFSSLYLCRR